MGCNPSKDGAVSEAGGGGGGGGVVKAGDKSSSSTTAKNDVAETFLIPLSDDFEERDSSLTDSYVDGENSKTMKTSEEAVDFEKEFRPDDVELCHAATKIQASFRGHMTRKQQAGGKDEPGAAAASAGACKVENLESKLKNVDINKDAELDELLDVDLADPELHKAATKIQASFRGHKVRKADEAADSKQ